MSNVDDELHTGTSSTEDRRPHPTREVALPEQRRTDLVRPAATRPGPRPLIIEIPARTRDADQRITRIEIPVPTIVRLLLVLIVVLVVLLIVTLAVRSGGEPAMSAPTVTVAPVIDPGSTSASPTPSTSPTSVPSLTEGAFTDPPASAEVSTPSAPVRRSPAANGREPGKRYEGSVAVDRYYKDLDLDPPDRRDDNDGADVVYTFQGPLEAVGSSTVAFWLHKGLPGYADCVAVAAAGGLQEADVENGDVVCFRTDEGRVGRLEVIDAGTDAAHFNAVVWELE